MWNRDRIDLPSTCAVRTTDATVEGKISSGFFFLFSAAVFHATRIIKYYYNTNFDLRLRIPCQLRFSQCILSYYTFLFHKQIVINSSTSDTVGSQIYYLQPAVSFFFKHEVVHIFTSMNFMFFFSSLIFSCVI